MKAIASANGLAATQRAYELLAQGVDALEACIAGVNLIEDDPADQTVGYGGLPNEDGVVELDAAVMHGPTHRAGAVAALRGIRHPSRVAHLVMQKTNRVLLVGEGALQFALANGFQEENLFTDAARQRWIEWKQSRPADDDGLPPKPDGSGPTPDFLRPTGTVHVATMSGGNISCVTSTSGHAFKIPGRVGDSPIVGAGLYVDNELGSCGSVGWGEANLQDLSSFAVIELLRSGRPPLEAALDVLRRIAAHAQPNQRDAEGRPTFNVRLFVLAKDGTHSGVTLWGPQQMAVTDSAGSRLEDCVPLFH